MNLTNKVIGYLLLVDNFNNLIDILKYNDFKPFDDNTFPYRASSRYIVYCDDIKRIDKIKNTVDYVIDLYTGELEIEELTKIKFQQSNQISDSEVELFIQHSVIIKQIDTNKVLKYLNETIGIKNLPAELKQLIVENF